MILPKLSAAILSMSFFGSAYAATELDRDTSLDQWVVISGATSGAAVALGVGPDDVDQHRNTALAHLMRYAAEHGRQLTDFDQLFERGQLEGRKLVETHGSLIPVARDKLISGFMHDKSIDYQNIRNALDA